MSLAIKAVMLYAGLRIAYIDESGDKESRIAILHEASGKRFILCVDTMTSLQVDSVKILRNTMYVKSNKSGAKNDMR